MIHQNNQEKPFKTIVITNRKGGVGKSTFAGHIAAGLAFAGYRVAIVDTDPQGHASLAFGHKKKNGLYHMMVEDDAMFADNLQVVEPSRYLPYGVVDNEERLFILPGSKGTALIPLEQSSPFRMGDMIAEMAQLLKLDFVVIDTGPSASMFDASVNLAADYFIYVTECALLSFDGLKEALRDIERMNNDSVKLGLKPTEILGIIPNKLRPNTNNHRENISTLAKQFPGLIWSPIRELTAFEAAMDHGRCVWSFGNDLETTKAVRDIQRVFDHLISALDLGVTANG